MEAMRGRARGLSLRLVRVLGVVAVALGVMLTSARVALATEYPDILLASFFNSQEDQTDTLYASLDGRNFTKLAEAYTDLTPNDASTAWAVQTPSYNVACLHDPSIIYHNGWFYMLSGFTNHVDCPSQFIPMIGYSKDLVHWAYPNSGQADNVHLNVLPPTSNSANFDIVAPEFFRTSSGEVYITFCAGYYGDFHGQPQNDQMYPYIVKLGTLQPGTQDPASNPLPAPVTSYGVAQYINLPVASTNRIDGSFYEENGVYYFVVKNNGVTNEIWSITDLSRVGDASAWTLVNANALTGFEGPSLVKYRGQYLLYTDKLADWPPENYNGKTGVHMQQSTSLATGWQGNAEIVTKDVNGSVIPNRHGTVMVVSDPAAKEVGWGLFIKFDPFVTPFHDVRVDWLTDPVRWVYENGVMSGYSDGTFGPANGLERNQLAMMLWNRAGQPAADTSAIASFTDCSTDAYYAQAVAWCVENGYMTGYSETEFGPSKTMTRQDFVTVLWRMEGEPQVSQDLGSYPDAGSIAEHAQGAMRWAVKNGVISGQGNGNLDPTGVLDRSQAAVIFYRMYA